MLVSVQHELAVCIDIPFLLSLPSTFPKANAFSLSWFCNLTRITCILILLHVVLTWDSSHQETGLDWSVQQGSSLWLLVGVWRSSGSISECLSLYMAVFMKWAFLTRFPTYSWLRWWANPNGISQQNPQTFHVIDWLQRWNVLREPKQNLQIQDSTSKMLDAISAPCYWTNQVTGRLTQAQRDKK